MPFVRDNGEFRFTPDECLTVSQIKSFFSSLTRKRRKHINNSQGFMNSSMNSQITQQQNLNDIDDDDENDESNEYDFRIAAQEMASLQQKAKEILKT